MEWDEASKGYKIDDYELQYSGKVNEVIPVTKYRSKRTGLRIVIAEVEGPLVNGYFCLGWYLCSIAIRECYRIHHIIERT